MEKNAMKNKGTNLYYPKLLAILFLPAVLLLTQCATVPEKNEALERARAAYSKAQKNSAVNTYSPVALYDASKSLELAEKAKSPEDIQHFSYLAEKQSQIAELLAEKKTFELEKEKLSAERTMMLMQVREREAEKARSEAEKARGEAVAAREIAEKRALEIQKAKEEAEALARQAEKARKEAEAKTLEIQKAKTQAEARALELEKAKKEAEARTLELEQARKESDMRAMEIAKAREETEAALAQRKQLESEIETLKAKKTERGLVLTLGDILFESGKAALMPGATMTIDQLVEFLKKYPNRNIIIEGHTDSIGSDTFNLGLSQERAKAVQAPLIAKGIAAERITTKGYGEKYPIASNANPAGRQQNRRVEIIILDEGVGPEKMIR